MTLIRQPLRRIVGTEQLATDELVVTSDSQLVLGNGTTSPINNYSRSIAVRNEALHLFRTGGVPFADNPSFDNTTAFNNAVILAQNAAGGGGGVIDFGPHVWGIAGVTTIPNKVNLIGPGGSTHGLGAQHVGGVRAIHADAQLRFGAPNDTGGSNRGGYSGGFSVYGADISNRTGADALFVVGDRSESEISNITVSDTLGNGVYMAGTQNSIFDKWNIARCGGDGLILDTFTLACMWEMLTIRAIAGTHLKMQNTISSSWAGQAPANHVFIRGLFEDSKNDISSSRMFDLQSSDNVQFIATNFVVPILNNTSLSACFIASGQDAMFHSCKWNGKNRTMEAIVRVEGTMFADGWTVLQNSTNAIYWANGGIVRLHGHTSTGGVTNVWHPSGTTNRSSVTQMMTGLRVDERMMITGELDHDGTTVGFYGTAPVTKPTSVTARAALEALGLGATLTSEGVTDGDKGDITVSSSGTDWRVDQIAGALNHDGTTAGFYGTTPVTKPASVTARAALEALGLAATLIAESVTYTTLPARVPIDNVQASDGSWPARPTSRTDIRVNYIGFPGLTNRPTDGVANLDSYVERTV